MLLISPERSPFRAFFCLGDKSVVSMITIDAQMMAALSREARDTSRRRKNRNFHTAPETPCQRLLNAIEPDSYVPPHRHLSADKAETIIVLAGRVGVLIFDDKGLVTMRRILAPTSGTVGADIPSGVYHSLVALEPGSVIFETKSGPYTELTPDERASWAPPENSPGAVHYLGFMADYFAP